MARSLTDQLHAFRRGEMSRPALMEALALYLYAYLHKRFRHEQDTASEIFCSLYNRLPGMVDRFVFMDRPFEAYLHITLNRTILNHYQQRRRIERLQHYSERIYCQDHLFATPDPIPEPELVLEKRAQDYFTVKGDTIDSTYMRRRLLCLVCKNAHYASDEQIRLTAQLTDVDRAWLESALSKLRGSMSARTNRHKRLIDLRRSYLAQAALCREEAAEASAKRPVGTERGRLRELNRRIRKVNAAIERLPLTPTHGEIARLLSMPKGSVDSSLHYVKHGLADLARPKKD